MSNVDTTAVAPAASLLFPTWESMGEYTSDFTAKWKRNPSMSIEDANALLAKAWEDKEAAAKMTTADYCEMFEEAEENEEAELHSPLVSDVVKGAISAAKKHTIALRAENMAAKAAADTTFNDFLNALGDKALDVERGPLDTNFHLRRIYGVEGLKEFPIVGSKGGNNPDLYQSKYQKADGSEGSKEFSYYTAFAASLPAYTVTEADLQACQLAVKDPSAANVASQYKGKTKWYLNARVRTLKKRLSRVKANCVRAFIIEQNLARINSDLGTKVKATLVTHKNDKGVEEAAPGIADPFMIGDWSNGESSLFAANQTLNITQFTGLDIDEAIKNGGTYDALLATIKRKPKGSGDKEQGVGTFDQLQNAWALSLGFYQTLRTPEQRATLKAKIVSDKAGFLETVFNLKDELIALCADTDLQKVYARHMQAKIKREADGEEQKTGTNG